MMGSAAVERAPAAAGAEAAARRASVLGAIARSIVRQQKKSALEAEMPTAF